VDGASFDEGEPVTFSGSSLDAEDGDLTASLSWSSDLDGSIGTGGSFSRSDLSPGVHIITASVADSGALTGSDQISITVNSAPVLNVTLTDDASVDSKNPTTGFGSSPTLDVRNHRQQIINSYLKFVVSGVNGTVQSAKLRLFSTKKSSSGGAVYLVSNDFLNTATPWNEDGLNFENAPLIEGTALSSVGAVSADSWVEFDVTEAIQADGTYSFGLSSTSSNRATYSSKEATVNEPVLLIDTSQ